MILKPLRTAEQFDTVKIAAHNDNHLVLCPTHGLIKDDKVVGYTSIMGLPLVHIWVDTNNGTVRDSLSALHQIEAVLRDRGITAYCVPCEETSPFYPLLPKVGFEPISKMMIFQKTLT